MPSCRPWSLPLLAAATAAAADLRSPLFRRYLKMKDDFIVVKLVYECAECALALDQPGLAYWLPTQYDARADVHNYKKRRWVALRPPPRRLLPSCIAGVAR